MSEFYLRLLGVQDTSSIDAELAFKRQFTGKRFVSANEAPTLIEDIITARGHKDALGDEPGKRLVFAGAIDVDGTLEGIKIAVTVRKLREPAAELASAVTDENGEFSISVNTDDLPVFQISFSRKDELLHTTTPRRAMEKNWVEWRESSGDVTTSPARPGLFELRESLIASALVPLDTELGKLDESRAQPDIATLAEMMGIVPEYLLAHAVTARVANELELPRAIVFSVLGGALAPTPEKALSGCCAPGVVPASTAGISAEELEALKKAINDDALLNHIVERTVSRIREMPTDSLRAAVDAAATNGIISCRVSRLFDSYSDAHQAGRRTYILSVKPGGMSTWQEVFDEIGVSGEPLAQAADQLLSAPLSDFILKKVGDILEKALTGAAEQLKLVALFDYSAANLNYLKGKDIYSGRALALLSVADLDGKLKAALASRPDHAEAAVRILKRIDRTYIGEGLLRRQPTVYPDTRTYALSGDLLKFNIEGQYRAGTLSSDADTAKTIRSEALMLQRVARLAKDGELAFKLVDNGYTSSARIAATHPLKFQQEMAAARMSADDIASIRRRARVHQQATMNLFMRFNRGVNGPDVSVFKGGSGSTIDSGDYAGAPSWETLFGSPDYCDCEECCSVTSPAAYLVDTLQWLQQSADAPSPYELLLAKRPDIARILLNCSNTNTLVPYIDLVNELLEDEVEVRSGQMTRDAVNARLGDRQTRLTAEEIRAYPEYIDTNAYSMLANFTDRMVSPLDLFAEEERLHLGTQGISRYELTRLFDRETGYQARQAAEYLGIPPAEFSLIFPDPVSSPLPTSPQTTQWGFTGLTGAGPWAVSLETFLRAAPGQKGNEHLSYDELLELLAARRFVNPGGAIRIALRTEESTDNCKAEQREVTGLTVASLNRMQQFLRLARRVPATFAELDLLIAASTTAGEAAELSAARADEFVALLAIRASLDISFEELAFLFVEFSASDALNGVLIDGRRSLYARTFLSRTDGGEAPAAFFAPDGAGFTLADARPHLVGALGIAANDFDALVAIAQSLDGTAQFVTISFHNLSLMYRVARLARALGFSIALLKSFLSLGSGALSPVLLRQLIDVAAAALRGADAQKIATAFGVAQPTLPPLSTLSTAVNNLKDAASAELVSRGESPTPLAIKALVRDSGSWRNAALSWVGLDTRYDSLLAGLDDATGGGVLFEGVYAVDQGRLAMFGWLPTLIDTLELDVESAGDWLTLPSVQEALVAPAGGSWVFAKLARGLYARAAKPAALIEFFKLVADSESTRDEMAAAFATAFGVDGALLQDFWELLYGSGDATGREMLVLPTQLNDLLRACAVAKKLGASPANLVEWATNWPSEPQATSVRGAIRSLVDLEEWPALSTRVQDMLRERRRDAMVRYLLVTAGSADPKSQGDLYGRLLIDVAMDDCMDTSRLVQANAAVQLFVQRCFLNLEGLDTSSLADDHWKQWEWRKNYRLWEANRLVFLYPENFLNVAQRPNASTEFGKFMSAIREGNAGAEAVQGAFESYLLNLESIGNLDYVAVATNAGVDDGFDKELHAVARTRSTPYRYFHRVAAKGTWTPWVPIDVGSSAANFSMVHSRGRTSLLWPSFADHQDSTQEVPGVPTGATTQGPTRAISYLTYNWTTRAHDKWSPVMMGVRPLLHMKRARNTFVTIVSAEENGFGLDVFSELPPDLIAETGDPEQVVLLGTAELRRDLASIVVDKWRMGLDDRVGGEHQNYLNSMGRFAPAPIETDPQTSILIDRRLVPWTGLVFDDGRMRSKLDSVGLGVLGAPGGSIFNQILWNRGARFSVAAGPGYTSLESFRTVGGDGVLFVANWNYPVFDVFAVTDEDRSFVVLSRTNRGSIDSRSTSEFVMIPGHHPYVPDFIDLLRVYDDGLERLISTSIQERIGETVGRAPLSYSSVYSNTPLASFSTGVESIDFKLSAPYALYNWELFFHAPMFVAEQLRQSGQFADARRFYQLIFTPFTTEAVDPNNELARYWVFSPFRRNASRSQDITDILTQGVTANIDPYEIIEDDPFDPHAVALKRPAAFQKHVFMRYLDNLIGWGDSLYRQGTRESVYEAIQYYVLAQQLLGERPQRIKPLGTRIDRAFADLDWSPGANALVELENLIADAGDDLHISGMLTHMPVTVDNGDGGNNKLYFCVPPNKRLLKYWDDIEQRLYNIRHCLTIDGVPVRYDLLSAPIDPQLLVDATAAGISVAQALAAGARQLPPYRFSTMWAKAWDACNEVKTLGSSLLSALEKRDGEEMAVLRSTWEGKLLERTRQTRETTRDQAQSEVDALLEARNTLVQRRDYYAGKAREFMIDGEVNALALSSQAAAFTSQAGQFSLVSSVMHLIPNFSFGIYGVGGSPNASVSFGGDAIGSLFGMVAQEYSTRAALRDRSASMVGTMANYTRRQEDWVQQATQTGLDIMHLDKQILAAKLRVAIAEAELKGHEVQERTWQATDDLLAAKFTNQERYEHHVSMLSELYRTAYEHAVSIAAMARECLAFELPIDSVPSLATNHWDSLQHGLLAGERLAADLRELERVHVTTRPFARVVSQHLPLSQVDSGALFDLRQTGVCTLRIPAWWFQRFDPNLTKRRVKSLSVSIPSVTGPYVGMNAKLANTGWSRTKNAISLSTGVNDAGGAVPQELYGAFEGLLLDEGTTTWTLGFPLVGADVITDVDYASISDVVLHFEYYAEELSAPAFDAAPTAPVVLIDVRSMVPEKWNELRAGAAQSVTIDVTKLLPTPLEKLVGTSPSFTVVKTLALLTSGEAVTGDLSFAVSGANLTIAGVNTVDWDSLGLILVALEKA